MDNVKIGDYIRRRLGELKITQERFAEMLNVSSSQISQALNGVVGFKPENYMTISSIFDEPVDKILNAGEERETRLEELSKLSPEEYKKVDPDFEKLKEKDSKGKTLFEYVIKNNNLNLIKFFQPRQIFYHQKNNLHLLTLLIKHDEIDLIKQLANHDYPYPRIYKEISTGNELESLDNFEDDQKELILAIIDSKNTEIHQHLPYMNRSVSHIMHMPSIVYYGVQFDKAFMLELEALKHDLNDYKSKHVFQSKYGNIIDFAIRNKSKQCIKFCYEKLNSFDTKKYFKTLIHTKDIQFIKWFIETYPNKGNNNHYGIDQQFGKFNNLEAIKLLIEDNDFELLKYTLEFSNQEALDSALSETKPNQIEIIKYLVLKGARFHYRDGYSGTPVPLEQISSVIKYLFEKKDEK